MNKEELRQFGFRLLSRKFLTRKELLSKLIQKGADIEIAKEFVQECIESGYIREQNIAEDAIRNAAENKFVSRRVVKYALTKRGLPEDLISEVIQEKYSEEDEQIAARMVAEKFYRINNNLPRDKFVRRLAGALERKGFSNALVSQLVREFSHKNENQN